MAWLSEWVRENRDEIVRDWERVARPRPVASAQRWPRAALVDYVFEVLDEIARSDDEPPTRPEVNGDRAKRRAEQRSNGVIDARQIVDGLAVLRDCVLTALERDRLPSGIGAQLRVLNRSIDRVVGEVVDRYVSRSDHDREAAKRRAAELESVIESLPEGIFIGTRQRIKRLNGAALEIAGWDSSGCAEKAPDELARQMRMRDAGSREPLAPEELPFTKALHGETAKREVLISRGDTGEDVVVRMSAAPIRAHGQVVGAVSLSTDITSEKRAEGAERESHARLQAILDNAPAAVFIRDRGRRYMLVNRWYAATFGVDPARAPGRTIRELHPERPSELVDAQEASDREVIEEGMPIERDESYTLEGDQRIHRLFAFPLRDSSGTVYAVCGISADMTARRRVEEARDRVIAILGHDLRNPVNAISLAARMLSSPELPPGALPRVVARIANSTERMSRMISDLLDFARGHLGEGIPITAQPTDLGVIARDVLDEMTTARPDLRCEMRCVGDLRGVWDKERLAQVLANLMGNAAEHRASGTAIRVDLTGVQDAVHLTVNNRITGIIDPEQLSRMFEPFRRIAQTASSTGGLGLGLFIVREIVRAHGGSVEARSSDGDFSIAVRLPRSCL